MTPTHCPSVRGFTMIELMMVVAVIAILALMAMPSLQDKIVRDQVVEALKLAEVAKEPMAKMWSTTTTLPANNAAAGLPPADRIVGNLVSAVAVESGAIQLTFGNRANSTLQGKTLSVRPAVVDATPVVPVAWVCGMASAPAKMSIKGLNKTDVPIRFLPLSCR